MSRIALLATASTLAALPTLAATQATKPDFHAPPSSDIIVTAPFNRDRADVLAGTSVLTGQALTRDLRPTIGETLSHQPGVSATSFGPNASRPVLRGFQGERVRVLKEGIGSIDVSNTSVDHAVVINPLTADRIEVLRGPNALLYGSSAIGGVVNVIDSRIPRRVPDEAVHVDAIASYGSAAQERASSGAIDLPIGGQFVAHVDGSYTKTGDLRTGGLLLSPALRAQARASGNAGVRALARLSGDLPNSAARTWEVAGGLAYIGDRGNIGVSFGHYDSLYGVPIRFSLDPAVEAEQVRLKVRQDRADLRAELPTGGGFLDEIRLRAGFADYRHAEIDDTGAIGTTFLNKSIEARLELAQTQRGSWQGASGAQYSVRDFNVIGAEAFVPKNVTQQIGIFTLQQFASGPFKFEVGGRYEHTNSTADTSPTIGNPPYSRRFDAYSGSVGVGYAMTPDIRVGLSLAHSERAPAAEELYAKGPHAGTQAFEIGDPRFAKERSNGAELSLRGSGTGYAFSLAGYYSRFSNYIYEVQTGDVEDDLPVFQFLQGNAEYAGVEGEAKVTLAQLGDFKVEADVLGDYTRARILRCGPVPRIPALRLLGGLTASSAKVEARGEVEWVDRQDRVTGFETTTPGYTMVNASLAFRPFGRDSNTSFVASANNIFDAEARRHASFLKDYAPLAGRDFRVTARLAF